MINLHLSSLRTSVLEASYCKTYLLICQICERFHTKDMGFTSTVIWYLTLSTRIWTPTVMCSQQLSVLHRTSNNEHDWNPIKCWNVLHHNITQKQLWNWKFYYMCKILFIIFLFTNFLFWVLWTYLTNFNKKDNVTLLKLWCLSTCK